MLTDLIARAAPPARPTACSDASIRTDGDQAKDAVEILARGAIEKAIDAYLKGFEVDWRDAYPGVNALTLMTLNNPADKRIARWRPSFASRLSANGAGNAGLLGPCDASGTRGDGR